MTTNKLYSSRGACRNMPASSTLSTLHHLTIASVRTVRQTNLMQDGVSYSGEEPAPFSTNPRQVGTRFTRARGACAIALGSPTATACPIIHNFFPSLLGFVIASLLPLILFSFSFLVHSVRSFFCCPPSPPPPPPSPGQQVHKVLVRCTEET